MALKIGDTHDGFRYKGGNPNEEGSWEAASDAPKPGYTPPLSPEQQTANIEKGRQDAFDSAPKLDQFAAGAGRWAYGFPGVAQLSKLAGYGNGNAKDETEAYDQASEGLGVEDVGEAIPDLLASLAAGGIATKGLKLGQLATTAAKKAMAIGGAQGAGSAAIHQVQNLGSGKGFRPGEAAAEVGLSSLAGAGGAKLAEKLKKAAPQVLRSAVKPTLNQMDVTNPPDFEKALEKNLVPWFGGLEGTEKRASKEVGRLGELRDLAATKDRRLISVGERTAPRNMNDQIGDLTRAQIKTMNTPPGGTPVITSKPPLEGNVLKAAAKSLDDEFTSPKGRMTKDMHADAKKGITYWKEQLEARPTYDAGQGTMTIEDAMHMRQAIDREIKFRQTNQNLTDGFNEASKRLRTQLNTYIKDASPTVGKLTDEMADVVPLLDALKRRNLQAGNNYKVGLLDLGSLVSGGTLGMAAGNPSVAVPALALSALAGRKLTSTPGGAAMMYDAGKSLSKSSATRNVLSQLARTASVKGRK